MPNPRLGLSHVAGFIAAVLLTAVLYVGRDFFLPIAIAVLIAFLLAPLVKRLESWHLSRIPAVLAVTLLTVGLMSFAVYVVAGQVLDLASKLPDYKGNLLAKVAVFKVTPDSALARVVQTFEELSAEVSALGGGKVAPGSAQPVAVRVVGGSGNALAMVREVVTPLLGPLGQGAIVVVFVIFMLLEREDLRDRFIHLVGQSRLYLTTHAIDEAAERVSRYLGAQLLVNVTYGLPIGGGLLLIGVPNAILWGFLATLLRFIPYVGPWIAASFPILLSVTIASGWWPVLLTTGLFVVMELVSNNLVEPWLYGTSTGLSPMAIIVSAVFWTSLWGAGGLLLATPLTVCVAVLGKYVPSLNFLEVLLGEKPPIAPEQRLYQRLLANNELEVYEMAEAHAEEHAPAALFDDLIVGALRLVEGDFQRGALGEEERREIHRLVRALIGDLEVPGPTLSAEGAGERVLILPAYSEADELAGLMLSRLLAGQGVRGEVLSAKSLSNEMVERAVKEQPKVVCISTVSGGSLIAPANLCKRLRVALADSAVMIGWWGGGGDEGQLERLRRAQPREIFTSLKVAGSTLAAQTALAPESASS